MQQLQCDFHIVVVTLSALAAAAAIAVAVLVLVQSRGGRSRRSNRIARQE